MASVFGQGKAYCRQAQEIVMNVFKYFLGSDNDRQKKTPLQETVQATGVSRQTIYMIRKHGVKSPKKNGPKFKSIPLDIDEFDRCAIRRIIQGLYANKQWPTLSTIAEIARSQLNFSGSLESLRKIMHSMGYKFNRRDSRNIVKERPDIVAKRHSFLLTMKDLRKTGRPIIYLDETWLNNNHTVTKCWSDASGNGGINVPSGKGSRLIILHAGSKDGFVPNALLCFQSKQGKADYHDEMDGDVFFTWFQTQLLPNIPPHSIILMDNASYHSVQSQKTPTLSSRKAEMQRWLAEHNINYDSSMIKAQLYQLIQANKSQFPTYIIDDLATSHGHTVVRIPPYHCEFNAIELIWAQGKGGVARHNHTFTISTVKQLLIEELGKITPQNWIKAISHVEKLEEYIFNEEIKIDSRLSEHELASFRFYPAESDSEDSDSESDDWPSSDDSGSLIWFPDEEVHSSQSSEDGEHGMPEFPYWTES